jgi:oligoribonuclease (3'-5' exoribonuclease)
VTLVYLDTETTGLNPALHEIVEVAWAVDDGPIHCVVLPHTLRNAEMAALNINGYFDRNLDERMRYDIGSERPTDLVRDLLRDLRGATLVGANPAFDAAFLMARFGVQLWHYRLLDIEAYAAGVFGWALPRGLKDVRDELRDRGWPLTQPDHTARGDVEVLRACHQALMPKAAS